VRASSAHEGCLQGQDSGLRSFRIRARVSSGGRCHLASCTAGVRAAWAPRERFSVQVASSHSRLFVRVR
jgi:hypothetical protein